MKRIPEKALTLREISRILLRPRRLPLWEYAQLVLHREKMESEDGDARS